MSVALSSPKQRCLYRFYHKEARYRDRVLNNVERLLGDFVVADVNECPCGFAKQLISRLFISLL